MTHPAYHGHMTDSATPMPPKNRSKPFAIAACLIFLASPVHATTSPQALEEIGSTVSTTIKQTLIKSTERDQLYQTSADEAQQGISISVQSFDDEFVDCRDQFAEQTAPTLVGRQGERLSAMVRALCFEGFATLHSGIARTPLWSASHLTKARVRDARTLVRSDSFRPELRLPAGERAELADYRRSGFDRGHIAPNGDMPNPDAQYASFSLANIAPQNGEHNRNVWRHIEIATRTLAMQHDEVFVVTGVAFLGNTSERIGGRVLVPSHFFKAVYIPSLSAAGVYFSPNDSTGSYQIISLDELAERTGINAMPALSKDIRQIAHTLPQPMNEAQAERVLLDSQSKSWLQFAVSAVRYVVEFLNRA